MATDKQENFSEAANYLSNTAATNVASSPTKRNVGAINSEREKSKKGTDGTGTTHRIGKSDISKLARVGYDHDDWYAMDLETRKAIIAYRKEHGLKPGRGKSPTKQSTSKDSMDLETRKAIIAYRKEHGLKPGRGKSPTKQSTSKDSGDKRDKPKSILKKRSTSRVQFDPNEGFSSDDDISEPGHTQKHTKIHKTKVVRRVIASTQHDTLPAGTFRGELDSHADNSMFPPSSVRILETSPETYKVYGYQGEQGSSRDMSLASIAVACDARFGEAEPSTVILVFHQVFVDETMSTALVNPNQLRDHGVTVEDTPKRYGGRHSISFEGYNLPLDSSGYVSYFPYRCPTDHELDTHPWIEVTSDNWDPYDPSFTDEESLRTLAKVGRVPVPIDTKDLARKPFTTPTLVAQTIKATSVYAKQTFDEPRYGRYGEKFRALNKRLISGKVYSDTFFSCVTSLSGFTCAQMFAHHNRYIYVVPMLSKSEAPDALKAFIDDTGRPEKLITDNAKEVVSRAWSKLCRQYLISTRQTEAYSPYQNFAETAIRIVKLLAARITEQCSVPLRLWPEVLSFAATLNNRTVHDCTRLERRTPFELIHGYTPDISCLVGHRFYDPVWYVIPGSKFPMPRRRIGRWLGPATALVSDLAMKVLTTGGKVIVSSFVSPLSTDDHTLPQVVEDLENNKQVLIDDGSVTRNDLWDSGTPEFNESSLVDTSKKRKSRTPPTKGTGRQPKQRRVSLTKSSKSASLLVDSHRCQSTTLGQQHSYPPVELNADHSDSAMDTNQSSVYDSESSGPDYTIDLHPELSDTATDTDHSSVHGSESDELNHDDSDHTTTTTPVPKPKTQRPSNAPADTARWEGARVRLPRGDATVRRKSRDANGEILGQFHSNPLLDSCVYEVDYDTGEQDLLLASTIADAIYARVDHDGHDWLILDEITGHYNDKVVVRWKDGSQDVVTVQVLKTSHPLELAEYAKAVDLLDHPLYSRWVPHVLRKGKRFASLVKSRNARKFEKYGIKIPKSYEQALEFDKENSNTFWTDAITKELRNISVGFNVMDEKPANFKRITGRLIFDIKPDLSRKARYVAGGHVLEVDDITYSSVVQRDSIRLLLLIAALNDLDISSTDLQNAYLSAPARERVYIIAGPEFGELAGKYLQTTPRTTHLEQALHVFSYLKRYPDPVLMMDYKYMRIEETPNTEEWNDFYPSATEPIPSNAPPPLGNSVSTTCFVDADWAGDKVNRRSHTGILLFVNRAPITWISKKQSTVETSTHGAELVASRLAVDTIDSLRYKLRMFGIPIAGPTTMWCDNMSVVHNGTRPDSTLKRKHKSISYHRIREAVAAGYIVIRKIGTKHNLADVLTKPLSRPATERFRADILSSEQ